MSLERGKGEWSRADSQVTNRLRRLSTEMELPLIEHVVVAGDGVRGIG